MPVTIGGTLSFCSQVVTSGQLELIRQVIHDFPRLSLTELSKTICELLDWRRPNGSLKSRECYGFLQQLQSRGWLSHLPTIKVTAPRGPRTVALPSQSEPETPLTGPLSDYLPVELTLVKEPAERRLFQQYLQRYHYLGYRVPYGAQLRYFVRCPHHSNRILACLLFTSAAWKIAPRDTWIGWDDSTRQANLSHIVNNSRFLILPSVKIANLASHILSLVARQLPQDWWVQYKVRPLLLETLVDIARFSGACYRAANWICIGLTQGRGRMDRHYQAQGQSPKQIFLYPLSPKARQLLCHSQKGDSL